MSVKRLGSMLTVAATPDLVPFLLERMGPQRVAVVASVTGGHAERGICESIALSTMTWCGIDDEGVVTMGGVLPTHDPAVGYVWQFITDGVRLHKRAYIEQSRAMKARMLQQYERCIALIEAEYTGALRHVRRNGVAVRPPQQIDGRPMCWCVLSRGNAHVAN